MNLILNINTISKRFFHPRYASFDNPYYVQSGDNQLACYYHWLENPKVYFVSFFASEGWEDRGYVESFDEWLEIITQESKEYLKEMEEDE